MRNLAAAAAGSALEIVRHDPPLAELAAVWKQLSDERHPGAPFRSHPWMSAWWSSFSAQTEPLVLLARSGADVVGILPLYVEPAPLGGRRVRAMGDQHVGSDYLGVICRPADAERVARSFAAHLSSLRDDDLQLDDLLDDDPLARALAAERRPVTRQLRYPCPFVGIDGDFDRYLAARPGGLAQQMKRRRRWLEKRPGYRFEILSQPRDLERGMEVLFELHRRRWALDGGSDGINGPAVEAFHRTAVAGLAALGWARLFMLHVEGEPRAVLYGFRHGDRFSFYQAGHDPAWRVRSVGSVLLHLTLQWCFSEGLVEFDFLHGDEPYKLGWATGARHTVRVRARASGARPWLRDRGRAAEASLRQLAKRILSPPSVQWLRGKRMALRKWAAGAPATTPGARGGA